MNLYTLNISYSSAHYFQYDILVTGFHCKNYMQEQLVLLVLTCVSYYHYLFIMLIIIQLMYNMSQNNSIISKAFKGTIQNSRTVQEICF